MSHEYRMEQLRAAIAAARKNFKKDANFFVVGLTYGCRISCTLIGFTPVNASYFLSRFCSVLATIGNNR